MGKKMDECGCQGLRIADQGRGIAGLAASGERESSR